MKIASIEAFPLEYPEPHYKGTLRYITLAKVTSDDGTVGWGECISQFPEAALATATIIERGYAPLLIGAEAMDVEALWRMMVGRTWWFGPEGIAAFGVSAVDMALWDLKGKTLGVSLSRLLGGQIHTEVPAMSSIIFDMEDMAWTDDEFRWMCDQGYLIVKGGWGMRPEAVFGQDRTADITLVERIRTIIGDKIELVVDTPGVWDLWDVPTAIQRFHDLAPYQLKWIEQPLLPSNLTGHARLRSSVSTPIGTGEDEWDVESYGRLIQSQGVDVIQLDPGRCQGVTGCREVIRLIEAEHLKYSMHTWSSALNTAASVHLMAISKRGVAMDFKPHESPMQHELVADPWVQRDGMLEVRDAPGLGVNVIPEVVSKYHFT